MIINSSIKDRVLFYLTTNFQLDNYDDANTNEILEKTETDLKSLKAILRQFQQFGFLTEVGVDQDSCCFNLKIEIHDFAEKGGFAIQDDIFKANIEKLGFEIENLKKQLAPEQLGTLNKISGIASALFAGLALLPK